MAKCTIWLGLSIYEQITTYREINVMDRASNKKQAVRSKKGTR